MAYKNKEDQAAAARRHYCKNKQLLKERAVKYKAGKVAHARKLVHNLKDNPCMDCGHSYPHYVMDFDHRDPTDKVMAIAVAMHRGWSTERLLKEINKCDLVCANCHRERTFGKN